jgi:hypothetical protein
LKLCTEAFYQWWAPLRPEEKEHAQADIRGEAIIDAFTLLERQQASPEGNTRS